jgi:hypothetical protein
MTTTTLPVQPVRHRQALARPAGSTRTDWIAALLALWAITGSYVDGWAHGHGKADASFLTPWHAILYTGVLALFTFLALQQRRGRLQGFGWVRALPRGYTLPAIGAAVFIAGGAFDMLWHSIFGIEVNVEMLLSPSHLVLATSGLLLVSGPLAAAWDRLQPATAQGWKTLGPMVISTTLLWSLLTFFTQFAHPINEILADKATAMWLGSNGASPWTMQGAGVAGVVLQAALLALAVLSLARHWRLPFGALTVMIGLNSLAMAVFNDRYEFVPGAVVAGLIADAALTLLGSPADRPIRLYTFGALVPVVYFSLHFLTLHLTRGIGWTIPLWAGAIYMAGTTGLIVSFVMCWPFDRTKEAAA